MYECPSCAGNLKFSIEKQKLYCEYCGKTVDPYHFYKEKDANETVVSASDIGVTIPGGRDEKYEVTIFTCPQCGGQILSEDTTAATFCSFCDSSTILDSRVSRERRPQYIIPFKKTKEDCKEAYAKMMRRAVFAPKEFKDKEHIEKFRAIYMPYWVYSFEKNGPASFSGTRSRRRGDYKIIKHYQLDCEIEESYKGLSYDASATFSDHLSSVIAPFDLKKAKPFVPSFLSGFYADTNDVDKYVYRQDAENLVVQDGCKRLARNRVCKKYHVEGENQYSLRNAVRPTRSEEELAMFPVWFLSYRKGDRVSYAVVNGQTGKVAAELPIDFKKYLIGSAVLAIPLFLLLNLFFTITPMRILWIAAILAMLCLIISNVQLSRIAIRESGADDKGLMTKRSGEKTVKRQSPQEKEDLAEEMAAEREKQAERRKKQNDPQTRVLKKTGMILLVTVVAAMLPYLMISLMTLGLRSGISMTGSINVFSAMIKIFVIAMIVLPLLPVFIMIGKRTRGSKGLFFSNWKAKLPTLAKPLAGIALAILILILNPVADEVYYIGAFLCMTGVLWAIMDIIKQHNLLTTRKLPQLNKRGGDENA